MTLDRLAAKISSVSDYLKRYLLAGKRKEVTIPYMLPDLRRRYNILQVYMQAYPCQAKAKVRKVSKGGEDVRLRRGPKNHTHQTGTKTKIPHI
jgi:hypothetical protein